MKFGSVIHSGNRSIDHQPRSAERGRALEPRHGRARKIGACVWRYISTHNDHLFQPVLEKEPIEEPTPVEQDRINSIYERLFSQVLDNLLAEFRAGNISAEQLSNDLHRFAQFNFPKSDFGD